VELDQNGALLLAIKTYVAWTGDLSVLADHRPRIRVLAEFALRYVFRHSPSGLLHNRREYWERHAAYGIEDGMELAHQLFASLGLSAAADLARHAGWMEEATKWDAEARRLKQAMLLDERYGMIHEERFIKRRKVGGDVQWGVEPTSSANLPPGTPLAGPGPHFLDPDTSSVLPIALQFVDPRGKLACNTLAAVEELWNQRWTGGGYGRYHASSEPDSVGPWPFASIFVARAYWEAGDDEKVWRILRWLGEAGAKGGSWFEFYGTRPVPPCPQIGIIPWTWAEIVVFFIHHVFGVRPGLGDLWLRPRLPSGVDQAEATVSLDKHRVHLDLRRARSGEADTITVNDETTGYAGDGLRLPRPQSDLHVAVILR
jgi:GH15 family glucan-1,4-alpha-glucosidase